jgi:hypothetical protein
MADVLWVTVAPGATACIEDPSGPTRPSPPRPDPREGRFGGVRCPIGHLPARILTRRPLSFPLSPVRPAAARRADTTPTPCPHPGRPCRESFDPRSATRSSHQRPRRARFLRLRPPRHHPARRRVPLRPHPSSGARARGCGRRRGRRRVGRRPGPRRRDRRRWWCRRRHPGPRLPCEGAPSRASRPPEGHRVRRERVARREGERDRRQGHGRRRARGPARGARGCRCVRLPHHRDQREDHRAGHPHPPGHRRGQPDRRPEPEGARREAGRRPRGRGVRARRGPLEGRARGARRPRRRRHLLRRADPAPAARRARAVCARSRCATGR